MTTAENGDCVLVRCFYLTKTYQLYDSDNRCRINKKNKSTVHLLAEAGRVTRLSRLTRFAFSPKKSAGDFGFCCSFGSSEVIPDMSQGSDFVPEKLKINVMK